MRAGNSLLRGYLEELSGKNRLKHLVLRARERCACRGGAGSVAFTGPRTFRRHRFFAWFVDKQGIS